MHHNFHDIEDCAVETAVGLLDALLDSAAAATPGRDAARYAADLRRLADTAISAIADLEIVGDDRRVSLQAVA